MPGILDIIKQVDRFSEEIIICDSGSTDGFLDDSIQKCLPDKVKVINTEWTYDYAAARNNSFSYATMDWIFWCDGDDILTEEFVQHILDFKNDGKEWKPWVCCNYAYTGMNDPVPSPRIVLIRRDKGTKWIGRIHEYLDYEIGNSDIVDWLLYHNFEKSSHKPKSYLKYLIEMDRYKDFTSQPSHLFYYGRELSENGQKYAAFLVFMEVLDNPNIWFRMRMASAINAFSCLDFVNDKERHYKMLVDLIEKHIHTFPRPDMYCVVGDWYKDHNNVAVAIGWYLEALSMGKPKNEAIYYYNDQFTEWYPTRQIVECYFRMNKLELANLYNEKILNKIMPDDEVAKQRRIIWFKDLHPELEQSEKA